MAKSPQQVPNAVARLKHQLATLVADEIDTRVKNKSQLVVTRPYERGYCTNLYCLLQVWTRIVVDLYAIPLPAAHVCLVLLTPPFMPTVLEDAIDQTVFTDLGCGRCIKLFLPSMAAFRYLHRTHTITTAATSTMEAEDDSTIAMNSLAPFSFDGTQCCCVVDSGFSFTHVVPTVDTKAVVRIFFTYVVLFTISWMKL
jgi:actin-related protein